MFTTSGLNLFTNFRNSISVEQMHLFNEYLALFIEYSYFLIEYLTKHKGKKSVILLITMKRIGLLSDTHGYLDPKIWKYFSDCDEIWHAGDIGDMATLETLEKFKPLRVVFGNIDNHVIRSATKEFLRFKVEEVEVLMTHIAGRPGKYARPALEELHKQQEQPKQQQTDLSLVNLTDLTTKMKLRNAAYIKSLNQY